MDRIIDELMTKREEITRQGLRPNPKDDALLLALLLEDAKQNPHKYARR